MTTYAYGDIPNECRTKLEKLVLWVLWVLWYLYPTQRWKESADSPPILMIQKDEYRSSAENNKFFVTFRVTIEMAENWQLLPGKPWVHGVDIPNSASQLPDVLKTS